ncbi:unnamed protein product [Meganyctiphanes norvegica]|uniref:Dehydrogenase/reductase SDR family member 12 n=1 Tax=Meganyctiphanes norvegica TaxID=48144 RepID=A0AAV2QAD2_MEGNR
MTFYRNVVWYCKGLQESGYESASKHFVATDLNVDCTDKHYMITGANSGIGKCIATDIAKRGGTIHMVCRNPTTAEEAKNEIISESNNQNVHLHLLDMSKSQDVNNFSKDFAENNKQLNVLINNAGCMINTRETTEDGLEKNFATNTLATYILTENLLLLMKRSNDPRVVTVTSGGMLVQKLDPLNLQSDKGDKDKFDGTMVYAQNKRQQVVITEQWADKHPEVHFSCMHPGWADTPAVRNSMPDFYNKMKDKLRTPLEGGDTAIWLAIKQNLPEKSSGEFFQDRKSASKHLPLAWSSSSKSDVTSFMQQLDSYASKYHT